MARTTPIGEADGSRLSTDQAAIVSEESYYRPVTAQEPLRGTKVILINKDSGVAVMGSVSSHPYFWTHWAPLPVFKD